VPEKTPLVNMDVAELNRELEAAQGNLESETKVSEGLFKDLTSAQKVKLEAEQAVFVVKTQIRSHRGNIEVYKERIKTLKHYIKAEAAGLQ